MKLDIPRNVAAVALFLVTAAGAHADLTVIERTTFDFSKMVIMGKPITPEVLAQVQKTPMFTGNGMDVTMYQSGNKAKVVTGIMTSLSDLDAKTVTILIPSTKKYSVAPIQEKQSAAMLAGMTANVRDMNKTQTFLGHESHLMKFFIKNQMMSMDGYAWMATDLPSPPSNTLSMSNPAIDMLKASLKGFPLKMTATINMPTLFGTMGFGYLATSVSTDPIPADTFTIPADYTKQDMKMPIVPKPAQ